MKKSVALVVLDSLRKDTFDDYFEWLPGKRFDNAWATSHWTVPVHGSLFTGYYASEIGVHSCSRLFNCPEPSLAEELNQSGYTTRAFSANVHISEQFGWNRGFDKFATGWRVPPHSDGENTLDLQQILSESPYEGLSKYFHIIWKCVQANQSTYQSLKHAVKLQYYYLNRDKHKDDGAMQALKFIKNQDFSSGEFLFLNLMEAHTPYKAPEEYQTVEPPAIDALAATLSEPVADSDQLRTAYQDCSRYLSDVYQEIFSTLEESFDYIITLADHGEAFGEAGAWAHLCGLYPEVVHVPLVISGQSINDGTCDDLVNILDVYQTIREFGGLGEANRGTSLLNFNADTEDRAVITEYHGLLKQYDRSLTAQGLDPTSLRDTREGIRVDDYYGFHDSWGEWQESGRLSDDPQALLSETSAELNRRTTLATESIPQSVEAQLRDLGYA